MYSIFDLDLYMYNNIFWDTRPQKIRKICENYFIYLKLKDYEKLNIWRIYFDIIKNMNIATMKYYTEKEWMIINSMTTNLKNLYKIEEPNKLIRACNYVCEIVRLALSTGDFALDKNTEDAFWRCMVELCNNTDFDFFHNEQNEAAYFTELIHSLYMNIINIADRENDKIKFESLVVIIFYCYKKCLDSNMQIFTPVFPETIIEKIKNVKNKELLFIGKFLLDLIDYKKRTDMEIIK